MNPDALDFTGFRARPPDGNGLVQQPLGPEDSEPSYQRASGYETDPEKTSGYPQPENGESIPRRQQSVEKCQVFGHPCVFSVHRPFREWRG